MSTSTHPNGFKTGYEDAFENERNIIKIRILITHIRHSNITYPHGSTDEINSIYKEMIDNNP